MVFSRKKQETERIFNVGVRSTVSSHSSNVVVNSKYTWYSFLPLILFTHITRFMNFYFILIGILQSFRELSPVNPWTTWLPIIVIFVIAILREGYDDIKLHREDKKINERKYTGYVNGDLKEIQSKDFHVGDVIILERDKECPADIIVLQSSEKDGTCSIETSNLDGETNLKERTMLPVFAEMDPSTFKDLNAKVKCQPPNSELYLFNGTVEIQGNLHAITSSNFIQAGTILRNTNKIIGTIVYAGKQTKLGLNSQKPPVKWTKIEILLNTVSKWVFGIQILLSIACGSFGNFYQIKHMMDFAYLEITKYDWRDWLTLYVRFFLLTTSMIPISLKVTLDICKFIYSLWIELDNKMILSDRRNNDTEIKHTTCANTSVIEDLGAVEYIFTDKTGTLTENVMELKKFSAKGVLYGYSSDTETIYEDPLLHNAFVEHDMNVYNLIRCLALCHTLKIENNEPIGISPEEISFIKGLNRLGITVTQEGKIFSIQSESLNIPLMRYEIKYVIPFNYIRKRMSVIVKDLDSNKYWLLTKGAGEIVSKNCAVPKSFEYFDGQQYQLAGMGLRVMAQSQKELSEQEFNTFISNIEHIRREINNREENEAIVYDNLEKDSELLGMTAIEDKLQQGVPETISMLRDAGIKIWMVTGDILQTAIKISFSTQLIQGDGKILDLSYKGTPVSKLLSTAKEYVDSQFKVSPNFVFYLTLQGTTNQACLPELLSPPLVEDFKSLASRAKCVIVSRATPLQKAQIVECIKSMNKTVLAIGDGGNDVPMIRAAQIGVGIHGKEGMQAAAAGDFALHQYRFLQRLLLVHGRYAGYRTSWLSQFCFYKSTVLCLIQLLFMFSSGFSGSSFFNSFNIMCYNAIFTILPVIFFLQDKDIEESSIFLHPYVYQDTQHSIFCNKRTLFWWYMRGIYQAIVITIIWYFVFTEHHANNVDGNAASLDEAQQVVYSALILIILFTVTLETMHFTALNLIFIWGSWILYVFVAVVASSISSIEMLKDMYLVMWRTTANPIHWCTVITMVSSAIAPPFFVQAVASMVTPTRTQIIRKNETVKRSVFEPVYLVSRQQNRDDRRLLAPTYNPMSYWDQSDSIFCQTC